ncbi:hypothetical protein TTHT_1903 [Thermotomaculum hydrothermale]|uniref:Uncharacterized protein n=1 Tax=Thermotomaculum hydrothermale TaxID=981385 RepID=A0A7R6PVC9_9BACT|nr:hypothetical protein [Thermotomaculum hydrothermale]BBB33357.1 hypothetical protein TTHT_1903 [Thermotomaculum hydrothermale]
MIWILFYYNSLPDMPNGCCLFSKEVMHRDFFMCNPTNTGHYEYPKFETLSYDDGCHCREVRNFLKNSKPTKYKKYVIFYTRHTNISGDSKNKIIGYFKVGNTFQYPRIGFSASESVLLPKDKCIDIDYKARGVPVSWGDSSIKNDMDRILNNLKSKINSHENISKKYQKETQKIMQMLTTKSGRCRINKICNECPVKQNCFWGKKSTGFRIKQLEYLYGGSRGC